MEQLPDGYFSAACDCEVGSTYWMVLDGRSTFPDPASRSQPQGVHGPSEVVDLGGFSWSDDEFTPLPLSDNVLYELHVGTFSRGGTFTSAIEHLDALVTLGVTAVEIMPVAQFPGGRNWGYDGAYPYAVRPSRRASARTAVASSSRTGRAPRS